MIRLTLFLLGVVVVALCGLSLHHLMFVMAPFGGVPWGPAFYGLNHNLILGWFGVLAAGLILMIGAWRWPRRRPPG